MQETLKKKNGELTDLTGKRVTLCLKDQLFILSGDWAWEMQSEALYCADVMYFPQEFQGTKGLIHPDDLPYLQGALQLLSDGEINPIQFRLITTYGEVKEIRGKNISLEKGEEESQSPEFSLSEEPLEKIALRKEAEFLLQRTSLADKAERLYNIGSFAINKSTGQTWYSDGVFHIYRLPPQSLNAHANTFNSFLHAEDRMPFLDAFEAAFAGEFPVHLEFRIVLADNQVHTLRLITHWQFNSKGQPLLTGILRELSYEANLQEQAEEALIQSRLFQQVIRIGEQHWNCGYWFINPLTHKVSFSDNYCRIYGLKPQHFPNQNAFLNLVHPDDRPMVRENIDKMFDEHMLSEMEFRIIRPDGKQRQLKQTGKLFASGTELLMIGVVQDITVQRSLEKKVHELNEKLALAEMVQQLSGSLTQTSFITWYPDGHVQWSEGTYLLLGYKPDAVEASSRILYKQLHPHDVKIFRDAEALVINGQAHDDVEFRVNNRMGLRHLKISFNRIVHGNREIVVGVIKDQTTDLALQQKLVSSVNYAEVLTATISDIIFLTDTENTIISWNAAAEAKTGIKAADAIYSNLFDLFPSLLEEKYMGRLKTAMAGNEVKELKVRNAYLSKAQHYYLSPLKNEQGEIYRILHVVQDVSRELELQQQLSQRLNFIESLVEVSVDRIVVLDKYMNYIYWNKKAEDYYALKKERVIGRNILEVFPAFRNDPSYNEFRKVLKGETVYIPPALDNEDEHYFETYLIPVKDEGNEVVYILWLVHDLTQDYELQKEKRAADEKIKEQAHYLKRITETTPDMISIMELATRKFTFLNADTFEAEGFDTGELSANSSEQNALIIHPDDQVLLSEYFGKLAITDNDNEIISAEYRAKTKQSEWKWFYVRGKVFQRDEENKPTHVLNVIENISDRKNAESKVLELRDALTRKATDKYLSLFNSIDQGFCIIEALFNEEGDAYDYLFLEANKAFEKQTGLVNAVGKTIKQLAPQHEQFWFDTYGRIARSGEPSRFEHSAESLGHYYEVFAFRIDKPEENHVAILFNDIRERKEAEARHVYLLKLSETLRSLANSIDIHDAVTKEAMAFFNADRCYYCEVEGGDAIIRRDAFRGDLPSVAGTYPLSGFTIFKKVIDAGQPFIVHDVNDTELVDEELRQTCLALQVISFVDVPVIKDGIPVGILCLVQSKPRVWTKLEVELAVETAERVWSAVERAKAEESLKQSEEKYRSQLEEQVLKRTEEIIKQNTILSQSEELAQLGSWEYDIATGNLNWSDGMYDLFSLPTSMIPRPEFYLDVAIEEDRHVARRIIKNLRKTHQSFEDNIRINKNGEIREFRIKASVVNNELGEPQKIVGVNLDISDIKQAERKAVESRHWLEQTTKASPDAISIYDLQNKQPIYLNDCLAEWTGYSSEELTDMGIEGRLQLIHPDDRLSLLRFNEQMLQANDGDILTIEYRLVADDKTRWLRNRTKVFQRDPSGKVTHILSLLQDITEEKAAGRLLRNLNRSLEKQNKELESKNEEIISFAFVASHDLKEPLRKILTFSDWLLQKEESLSETGKQSLARLVNAVKRMDMLVEDVVALSKVHIEKEDLHSINLDLIVMKAKQEMQEMIDNSGAEIMATRLPAIKGVENHLVYLFKNLLNNSIKFQQPGNKPAIQIASDRTEDYIKIVISDNGIGFSTEFSKRIFQMFRRLHGKHEYEGTGMGLAICKRIMEKHGGLITAESKPGKGATFTCWFPITQ